MNKKIIIANQIMYYGSIAFAILVLIKSYLDRRALPEGVCPLEQNRTYIYISIVLLILSFIIDRSVTKKLKDNNDGV